MQRELSGSGSRPDVDSVLADYMQRLDAGEPIDQEALIAAHPELADELRAHFSDAVALNRHAAAVTADFAAQATPRSALEVRCPSCHAPMAVAVDTALTDLTCPSCGSHFSLVDQTKATRLAPSLSKMGRFELIERIGVGGFGSVWKARDKELDRTVAVKIPRQGAMTAEEQEKFFREARAAAQLKHPNIVSVHEVGRDGDSVYIVSDFVRGVTLGDWLTGQQLTSREAAELCAKIADALHHAHEQGVVHRDLKPANIMIDADGQPHLMDFGLARRDAGEVTVTIDGQILGTPAYMSPEQAAGEAHTADRRSDVYSLGVILFQLLTGELPFRGNARMLMHQVINDEPPSPRKLNANVKRDLETVTLKCLEKQPARRYQTAQEVAAELRRFLLDKPIQARPIGPIERCGRWVKHNPRVAALTAAVAILLVAVAALSLTGFAIAKKQQLTAEQAVRREAHLRDLAEQNLGMAEDAVNSYLTKVAEDERLKQADFHRLRTELLETAIPFYERFAKQQPGNLQSDLNRATAYARLASIHGETGRQAECVKEFKRAIELQNALVEKHPDNHEYQRVLADYHSELGWYYTVGSEESGKLHFDSAVSILSKLIAALPDEPAYRYTLAATRERYGLSLGYGNASRQQFEEAVKLADPLVEEFPEKPEFQRVLALALFRLSMCTYGSDPKGALEHLTKSAQIQRQLVARYPTRPDYRAELSESVGYAALAYIRLGDNVAATRQYEESVEIQRHVVDEFPSVVKYRVILANLYTELGLLKENLGDYAAAQKQYEQEVIHWSKAAADLPKRGYSFRAANAHIKLGRMMWRNADLSSAAVEYNKALELYKKLNVDRPGSNRTDLAATLSSLATLQAYLGEGKAARDNYEQAINVHSMIAADHPSNPEFQIKLAATQEEFGRFLQRLGEYREAEELVASALELYEKLLQDHPNQPELRSGFALLLNNVSWQLATSTVDELRDGERAIDLATKACELTNYKEPMFIDTLAAAHAEADDFDEAVEYEQQALALLPSSGADELRSRFLKAMSNYIEKKPTRVTLEGVHQDAEDVEPTS